MLEHCLGNCIYLALVRSGTTLERFGLARSQRYNSFQKCSMGLTSRFCAGQSSSSTSPKQERAFHKLLPKVGSTESSTMSLSAVALRFPFTETKGHSPNHEKQPQTIIPSPPNFTVGTMHWDRYMLLASAKPRFVRRTARW